MNYSEADIVLIEKIVNKELSELEQFILKNWNGPSCRSLAELSKKVGRTRERVRQIYYKAQAKVKQRYWEERNK
jgi:DNA-directed RNA polymerase sigma subunit (sigma70/sigma32)